VGSDRRLGVEKARQLGADTVVLDDGFQHRRLSRDLDIVLLDAEEPFGNGYLLPAGPLREPVEGLARADLVIVTRSDPAGRYDLIEETVRKHNPAAPILRAGHRRVGFFDAEGHPAPRPSRVLAFCGIGNPVAFERQLSSLGVRVVDMLCFRDHHRYTESDIERLHRRALQHRVDAVVTTQKDAVKIPLSDVTADWRFLLIQQEIARGEENYREALLRCLAGNSGG
jgi:tetraacyldisaccharide 4'-kinase